MRLVLQGKADYRFAALAAQVLYDELLACGVQIFTNMNGAAIDTPAFMDLFALMAELEKISRVIKKIDRLISRDLAEEWKWISIPLAASAVSTCRTKASLKRHRLIRPPSRIVQSITLISGR